MGEICAVKTLRSVLKSKSLPAATAKIASWIGQPLRWLGNEGGGVRTAWRELQKEKKKLSIMSQQNNRLHNEILISTSHAKGIVTCSPEKMRELNLFRTASARIYAFGHGQVLAFVITVLPCTELTP